MEKRKASPSVLSSIPKGSLPLQILSFVTIVMCLLVEELQKQVETLRGENKKLLQENQKLKQVEELQRQVETLTREKTKLLEENRKVKQVEELQRQVETLTREKTKLLEENRKVKQVEELQRQVETLTREKTKLLEENRKVKQDLGKKNANMEELRNEVAILREEKKHLQQRRELGIKKEEGQKKPTLWQNAKQKFHEHFTSNIRTALDGSASRDNPQPVENSTEETAKEQNDHLPLYRCDQSCGRDNFFALNLGICPRRALVDIYVDRGLKIVEKSLDNLGFWNDTYKAVFKEINAVCGRLQCCGFLPLVAARSLVKVVYDDKITGYNSFYDALKKGKKMLGENGRGILVYTYKYWRDGRHLTHCVEMQFDKHSEVEDIDFIDNQSQKHLKFPEDFPQSCLLQVQVLEISKDTKGIKDLHQNHGTCKCSEEDGDGKITVNIVDIMRNYFREERESKNKNSTTLDESKAKTDEIPSTTDEGLTISTEDDDPSGTDENNSCYGSEEKANSEN